MENRSLRVSSFLVIPMAIEPERSYNENQKAFFMTDNIQRFCEERYTTKDEVLEAFNYSGSAQLAWNEILNYRKARTVTPDLHSIDQTKFSYVSTSSVQNRILKLERAWNRLYFKYARLPESVSKIFVRKRLARILDTVARSSSSHLTEPLLRSIIGGNISTIPNDAVIVSNYLQVLNYLSSHEGGKIDLSSYNALDEILMSGSIPLTPLIENRFRRSELDSVSEDGAVYKAAPLALLDAMFGDLLAFVNGEDTFLSVKAILGMYYFYYLKPYDLLNDKLATLSFKLALSHEGMPVFASMINVEGFFLSGGEDLKKIDEKVQQNYDLTYFLDAALDYLLKDASECGNDLSASSAEAMNLEQKEGVRNELSLSHSQTARILQEAEPENAGNAAPVLNPPAPEPVRSYARTLVLPVDVALPIFTTGFSESDIERLTSDLLETYPALRPSQAHFYATHCTIGRSYTIQEFKNGEGTSYETARTSMDYLASIGLYEKAKVRNKFVYRPIPQHNRKN